MERPTVEALYAKRQHCKRGHDLARTAYINRNAKGVFYLKCRECARATRHAKTRSRQQVCGLVSGSTMAPLTNRHMAARFGVATRLARYGASQKTPEGVTKHRSGRNANRQKTVCHRGHPLTPNNVYRYVHPSKGWIQRQCKACISERRRGRPSWLIVDGVRISIEAHDRFYRNTLNRLKHRQIAAHPDKGGTSAKFIKAKKALERFQQQEAAWYASVNLQPPTMKRRAFDRAASFQRAS